VGAGAGAPGAAKTPRAKAEATKRASLENISSRVKEGGAEEKQVTVVKQRRRVFCNED
jgi:hypothetical protein